MKVITQEEAVASAVSTLGYDPEYVDLTTPEVIADTLRWTASQRCPLTRATLRRVVVDQVGPLTASESEYRESVDQVLDTLLASSDLVEQSDVEGADRIFLGPLRYLRLSSGQLLLLGVRPGGLPLVGTSLDDLVDHRGPLRFLAPERDGWETDTAVGMLEGAGFVEILVDEWIKAPPLSDWSDHLARIEAELDRSLSAVSLDPATVKIFDPRSPQGFYNGRWREVGAEDDGVVLARRPQAYGADRWSVLRLVDGSFAAGFDLPIEGALRPCDEAWRIMAAMDAREGHPIEMYVAPLPGERSRLDFFAPAPNYLERLLSTVGISVDRDRGALLSFAVNRHDVDEVARLFLQSLWGRIKQDGE